MSDSLITRLLRKMAEKNQDRLLAETESLMADEYGIDVAAEMEAIKAQDVPEIVADYYLLLKVVHHGEKPKQVKLDSNCHLVLIVDGIRYDMKKRIRWQDQKSRQCMREIEFLFKNDFFSAVQSELNEKIQKDW